MMNVSVNAQGAVSSYDTLFSFCIPQNDKLYGYWDTVTDRLFKIRHCMNIAGIVRSLPLFAPPIDPALLVRASAAGLDIATILSSLYEPLPKYRFNFMLQKAIELCGEARGLGGELLSTLEKKDAEGLSLLRSAHEVSLLQAIRELKRKSVEEAEHNLDALERSKESAEFRRDYYGQKQLMNPEESIGIGLISAGAAFQTIGQVTTQTALPFYPVPKTISGTAGLPTPAALVVSSDWEQMTEPQKTAGSAFMMLASLMNTAGSLSQTMGGYKQRKSDWDFQAGLTKREIEQLDKQILAAEIRLQIAEADLENHEKQIARAEEAEAFLKTKFTNQELYSWTVSKISTLYFQTYQMAYKLAQQAEKCFQHELGPEQKGLSFISNYYW